MEEQENMNTNRGKTNDSTSADVDHMDTISLETAKDGEQSTVVSSRVCTSSTSRAVWEKIQDAKQIQRTHRHNAPKYSNARHHLLSGRSKDGIRDAEDFSNVNRVTTAGFPAEACVAVSPVSVVPPVLRAKPVKPLELLPRHNILKTAITGEDTRPEHPTTVRVDEVVRVAQAVYRIQVAWRRYKKRRDPSNQRTDTGTCVEAADAKYVGNEPNVQSDSPELPRPSAATKKSLGRRAKAGEIGATAEHLAQMDEDISPLEHCSGELIDVKDPQPLGTLWMEDEWVSLEEGLYLGDQKDEFCAFSSSIHEFLLWKQPHNLIQIRENQRLAALRAQRQWRADTSTDIVITTNESQDEKSEDNLTQNRKTPSPVSSLLCQIPLSKARIRSRRWRAKPVKITFRRRARKRAADCVISNHDQSNSLQPQLVTNLNDQSEGDADESSSVPVKSCESVKANDERVDGNSVATHDALANQYVVFSSPATHEEVGEESSSRNDLISIGDLTVAGDLRRIMSKANTHSLSDFASRSRGDQPNVNRFIPPEMIALGSVSDDFIQSTRRAHENRHFTEKASHCDDFGDDVDLNRSSSMYYIVDGVEGSPLLKFPGTASQQNGHVLRLSNVPDSGIQYESTNCADLISAHFGSDKHELHTEKHDHAVAEDVPNDDPAGT